MIATAIDNLDKHECSQDSISVAIGFLLECVGYNDQVVRHAAGIQSAIVLEEVFRKEYWRDATIYSKMKALMSAVMTADNLIKSGGLDARIMQTTEETLRETGAI